MAQFSFGDCNIWVVSISFGQAIMKAAKQMVFIIDEKQFVGKLEGAVPVLIQQVRMLYSAASFSAILKVARPMY